MALRTLSGYYVVVNLVKWESLKVIDLSLDTLVPQNNLVLATNVSKQIPLFT